MKSQIVSFLFAFLRYLFMTIGAVVFFKASCAVYTFLRIAFTRLNESWAAKYGKGSWAIVTGCTEGIGKAFCFQLASLGFNLVLISRNQQKLDTLSNELWAKHSSLHIVSCQTDFSQYNRSLYENIMKKISHLNLSILVNNVGISHIQRFEQQSTKHIEQQINVNINAMTFLSHKVIPLFLDRKKPCAIINISSQSIGQCFKNLSVYTGTKAYNDQFSRCLSRDYTGLIDVLDVLPGIVSTQGTNHFKDSLSCSSQQCANWSLKALGKTNVTAGYWAQIVSYWLATIVGFVAGQNFVAWFGEKKVNEIVAFKKE